MVIRPSLLSELKRRNVLRAGALYGGMVWLLAQVITQLGPVFDAPLWIARWFLAAAVVGFPFWVSFAWFYELTPEGLKRESEVEPGQSLARSTARRLDRAIIVVLSVAVVLLLTDRFVPRKDADVKAAIAASTAIPQKSIAVLPLVNGGGEGQQFFSDGLSEALIIALSQFDGLKVIGRNSSFLFRDTKDGSAVIGRKLGVAHLLEGSVQHAGDMVRVSVELIDVASGQTRWSQQYDRPYKDLFKLQDEITQAIAGALQAKLVSPGAAAQHSDRPPSGNIDAYNAYLQGLKYWHDQAFPKAAGYMARAVQLDPGYALAWAHLSGSWSTVAAFLNEAPAVARGHMREARLAADKALQLAPGLGPAHAALAYLQFYHFDFRGAWSECRRAVQLAPDDGTVLNGCGYTLTGMGKLGEAIRLRERLLSIEPLYTVNYVQYARLLAATGRLDEAEKYLRTGEEVAEPYPMEHLKLAVLRGDANAALEIATQASPHDRNLAMALATQIGPDRAAADKWLADMLADKTWVESIDGDGYDNRYKIARVYALRGDAGRTLEWLERSLASNPSRALFLLADPFLLRFRDDPRFIAFCKRLGLPPPSTSEALSIDQIRTANAKRG
jgi:TolB-like protein/Tfp pilus assembly protein PilF